MMAKEDAPPFCHINDGGDRRVFEVTKTPNYFFKTSPDGKLVYFISEGKNWILDTTTNQLTQVHGTADPVPSPDGAFLTTLQSMGSVHKAYKVFATPLESGLPVPASPRELMAIQGSYQSVGNPTNGNYPFVYYDYVQGTIKLRTINPTENFSVGPELRFSGVNPKQLRLPMMSLDGTRLSALNTLTNRTEIYRVQGSTVTLEKSLPFATGKASFSVDSTKVTFHVARGAHSEETVNENDYPAVLSISGEVRDVFVYDLNTESLQQITHNIAESSYFPVFVGNEEVAYINSDSSDRYSITFENIQKVQQRNLETLSNCHGTDLNTALTSLADLWKSACTEWSRTGTETDTIFAANLNHETCLALANRAQDPDMRRLCETFRIVDNQSVAAVAAPARAQAFQTNCTICHTESAAWFAERVDQVARYLDEGTMPPGGGLGASEKTQILNYLRDFRTQSPSPVRRGRA